MINLTSDKINFTVIALYKSLAMGHVISSKAKCSLVSRQCFGTVVFLF